MIGAVLVAGLCFAGSPGWSKLAPKGASFEIQMPGQAVETQQTSKIALGTIAIRSWSLPAKEGTYVVGLTEYPEKLVPAGQDAARLDQARNGALEQSKGRLRWEKNIAVDGRSGREIFIATDTGHAIKVRLIADRHRLYQLMVVGNTRFLDSPEAARFLESFRLPK